MVRGGCSACGQYLCLSMGQTEHTEPKEQAAAMLEELCKGAWGDCKELLRQVCTRDSFREE